MVGRTGIDRLYSVTVPPARRTSRSRSPASARATFAAGATAQDVEDALQAAALPGRHARAAPTATATARAASSSSASARDYLIGFRGERNGRPRRRPLSFPAAGLTATGAGGAALDVRRIDGINYYGLETLDIALGQGDDVFNVQGTLPVTNVSLNGGNERVYVSHLADVGIDGKPDYLRGHLDDVDGALNLDFGAGRHTLMISDEMATRRRRRTVARSLDRPPAGISIAGLATGTITLRRQPATSATASRSGAARATTRSRSTARAAAAPRAARSRR